MKNKFSGKLHYLCFQAISSLFNFLLHSGALLLGNQKYFLWKFALPLFPGNLFTFQTSCSTQEHYSLLTKNNFSGKSNLYGSGTKKTAFLLDIDFQMAYSGNCKCAFTVNWKGTQE
jgi:hypothetical protein